MLYLGEPRLKGLPKGADTGPTCADMEGDNSQFTTQHGGMEKIAEETDFDLPLELPGSYAPDYDTPGGTVNGRVIGIRTGNEVTTALNRWTTQGKPWRNGIYGGWVDCHQRLSRAAYESQYNEGITWKLATTRTHSGTYSVRHVQGYQENPSNPPSGEYSYSTRPLMPWGGLSCTTRLTGSEGDVESMTAYIPYSVWVTTGQLITIEWWSYNGYTGNGITEYDPYWTVRFIYGTQLPSAESDTDDSYWELSSLDPPLGYQSKGGPWEFYEASSQATRDGACQIFLQSLRRSTSTEFDDQGREWLHVDDARIILA